MYINTSPKALRNVKLIDQKVDEFLSKKANKRISQNVDLLRTNDLFKLCGLNWNDRQKWQENWQAFENVHNNVDSQKHCPVYAR